MIYRNLIVFTLVLFTFQSCMVTESIGVNEDGSGDFLVTYDLSQMSDIMGDMMKSMNTDDLELSEDDEQEIEKNEGEQNLEPEKQEKVIAKEITDTTIVFDQLFITYKDSIAALPQDQQDMLELLKGMYMSVKLDESKKEFKMGVGMAFDSFDELKDIQQRVKAAREMNSKDSGMDRMTENSPLGGLMGDDQNEVVYSYKRNKFSRRTLLTRENDSLAQSVEEMEQGGGEFKESFKEAFYVVSYTFPKRIKKTSIENPEISQDRKSITYKTSWLKYLTDPTLLDIEIEFEDE